MPKRKLQCPETEESLKIKRQRNAERQRKYRERIKSEKNKNNLEQSRDNLTISDVGTQQNSPLPNNSEINTNQMTLNTNSCETSSADNSSLSARDIQSCTSNTPNVSVSEVEESLRIKRQKNAERQRKYRERIKNNKNKNDLEHNISNELHDKNLIRCNIDTQQNFALPHNNEMNTNQVPLITNSYESSVANNYPSSARNIQSCTSSDPHVSVSEVEEHYIGKMDIPCVHCNALHFAAERVAHKKNSFNDCCKHGAVVLNPLPEPPAILRDLFNGKHKDSKHFHERIRCYNNSFAFASFNANLVNFNNRRPGPFCFKIHGQIYYQMNKALYPSMNENPSYGQLFIVDQNEATDIRCNAMSNLNREVVTAIDNALRACNPFAESYRMMHEEVQQSMRNNRMQTEPEMQLLFSLKPGYDSRRYNLQRINEVAAIFTTTADGDIPESYVTVHNKQTKDLQYINSMDDNVEPMIYPLYYPRGTKGWRPNIPLINKKGQVSRAAHVKYRMAIRDNNVFLMGGRLFQQWVVDSYVKIEKDRTNFCRFNQKTLRADTYQGLIDHLQSRADEMNTHVGKMVILPSSFTGSPRNMLQHYQDAMAIVRKFGKPDLFITMTCNPNWIEIQENLLPGQTASDRPDIVSRVFNIKKDAMIQEVVKNSLFGKVLAYVYVVEYQKRGLPHVHLLLTLQQNNKITTTDVVDKYISAEIPSQEHDPNLHDKVMKHMIHSCGDWCKNEHGKCSKHFPKNFQEETTMDENGYPTYRRKNTGVYNRSNGTPVDNQYVVPYNPTLLKMFNCHINTEVVTSIKSVKYLYKYIYKGHDAAAVVITDTVNGESISNQTNYDEINNFLETRYVGPVEAVDRIYGRSLQNKSHSITRLPIHLPNQQSLTITDETENAVRTALEKTTMLIEYFTLNERDIEARQYTYSEIPCHYVYSKEKNSNVFSWKKRKSQFSVIGRMYSVSPTQIELFHLRLLLLTVKGATSFENLRTVNGQIYPTFHSTCLALGLIEDDAEWDRAMTEGEVWMMPRQLRRLFIRILIFCQPHHPDELWEKFKDAMSQDFQRNHDISEAERKAYLEINKLLSDERSDLSKFPTMPQITDWPTDDPTIGLTDSEEMTIEQHTRIGQDQYDKLNVKQKKVIDDVLNVVSTELPSSPCFYIDGPGGSGKTFTYTTLYHLLKAKEKNICTMAFTGIAAILLPQGKTVHKTFGMPVPLFNDSVSHIKSQTKDAQYLREVDIFIWDEAPMAPRYALELVDRTLRDMMNVDSPFGGKLMILGGDFRQLLPVKPHATRSELVNLSIKFSSLWKHFSIYSLTENMRALPQEAEFAKYLLSVGDGVTNDRNDYLIPPTQCLANRNDDPVKVIFDPIITERRIDDLAKVAILSARNADVDEINTRVVQLFDKTTERIYTSIDSVENCDNGDINDAILPEYLNSLNPPSFPPHELRLRTNCIIMLIRNLSINEGLCNGTRLQVMELANNLLRCRILTGDKSGEIVFINRITLYCEDIYPFTFKRRQFPVKLAFAMTINKSQGQTFDKIGVDLRKDTFNHGQLYVAFSRVRSWNSLQIFLGEQRLNNLLKNHVYTELYT